MLTFTPSLKFTPSVETFVVEEVPAYLPSGTGEHTYLWIEKRGVTTLDAIRRIGDLLGVDSREIGYAGMKDRNAVTRQWISLQRVEPERAMSLDTADIKVLAASRHGNKLRLGHSNGNRFELVVTVAGEDEALALGARLAALAAAGLPNRFGDQRFGAAGDNAAVGLALLRGERHERNHRVRKLLLSAAQSAVFNRVLDLRAARGGLRAVLAGDVLQKVATGGLFITDDVAVDQARVDAGELVPTGPMPGGR
ncbi:MAG: tRNA pseudouridine 13 synthase, partial [Myxococcales bacterium]|nr:tRNA pseudouridine 13 synthase [Myxococcales bacterium]